ncbi:hypothetical protein TPY_2667 [Sulfobacillus acidophilus TPY]|uniref:Helicase HerA central domain-containing protein n=1 Tax=Sulfobacillus acidophilus (strain ATCC 700253 / DSM 10332 / NAL) TaxID=679936 RepID=G8TV74_SULAD|nr:hypothetical protein TPY_2667 [Sulfobacillus acidophilus TPY]AEW04714.1 protein of unknown function DUF87 [Sulfobacillus acidophilus DSM 10332]
MINQWSRIRRPANPDAQPGALDHWYETARAIQLHASNDGMGVAHQAFVVTDWPPSSTTDYFPTLQMPLHQGQWPTVHWMWAATPSRLDLDESLAKKIRRLELMLTLNRNDTLGPRRDEYQAYQGLIALRNLLLETGGPLVDIQTIIIVTSPPEWLASDVQELRARWQAYGIHTRLLDADQLPALLRTFQGPQAAPLVDTPRSWMQRLRHWIFPPAQQWEPRTVLPHRASQWMWPGWGQVGDPPSAVYVGHTPQHQPVFVDFRRTAQSDAANVLVAGATGSGKSFWMKTLVQGLLDNGFRIIIFDVDGEYRALCHAVHGTWIDVSADGGGAYPDPLTIPDAYDPTDTPEHRWRSMLGNVSRLLGILGQLTESELAAVERSVVRAWATYNVTVENSASWPRTVDDPHPTMEDVWHQLDRARPTDVDAGAAADKLWRAVWGSQSLLFQGRRLPWTVPTTPLTVWYLGNLARTEQTMPPDMAARYALVLTVTWGWLRHWKRQREWSVVAVDEAQRIIPQPVLGASLVDLASTIRKWNGVLLAATNTLDPLREGIGAQLWDHTPVKALLKMENNHIQAFAPGLHMPPGVQHQWENLPENQVLLRTVEGNWAVVEAVVPPGEEQLYRTRGG